MRIWDLDNNPNAGMYRSRSLDSLRNAMSQEGYNTGGYVDQSPYQSANPPNSYAALQPSAPNQFPIMQPVFNPSPQSTFITPGTAYPGVGVQQVPAFQQQKSTPIPSPFQTHTIPSPFQAQTLPSPFQTQTIRPSSPPQFQRSQPIRRSFPPSQPGSQPFGPTRPQFQPPTGPPGQPPGKPVPLPNIFTRETLKLRYKNRNLSIAITICVVLLLGAIAANFSVMFGYDGIPKPKTRMTGINFELTRTKLAYGSELSNINSYAFAGMEIVFCDVVENSYLKGTFSVHRCEAMKFDRPSVTGSLKIEVNNLGDDRDSVFAKVASILVAKSDADLDSLPVSPNTIKLA